MKLVLCPLYSNLSVIASPLTVDNDYYRKKIHIDFYRSSYMTTSYQPFLETAILHCIFKRIEGQKVISLHNRTIHNKNGYIQSMSSFKAENIGTWNASLV